MFDLDTWQYVAWTKPVTPPGSEAERTQPDKWYTEPSRPDSNWRKAALVSIAVLAPYLAFLYTPPATAETVTLDKWYVQASEPVRRIPRAADYEAYFGIEKQPTPRPEGWIFHQDDFARTRKPDTYAYPSHFAPVRQPEPRLESWIPCAPDFAYGRKPDTFTYPCNFSILWRETPTSDRWYPQYPSLVFKAPDRRWAYPYHYFEVLAGWQTPTETVTPDKWLPRINEPVRITPITHFRAPSFFFCHEATLVKETIRPDKWYPVYPSYIWRAPNWDYLTGGESPRGIPPFLWGTVDKWSYPAQVPFTAKGRLSYLLPTPPPINPSLFVTADKWAYRDPLIQRAYWSPAHLPGVVTQPISVAPSVAAGPGVWISWLHAESYERFRITKSQHESIKPTAFSILEMENTAGKILTPVVTASVPLILIPSVAESTG